MSGISRIANNNTYGPTNIRMHVPMIIQIHFSRIMKDVRSLNKIIRHKQILNLFAYHPIDVPLMNYLWWRSDYTYGVVWQRKTVDRIDTSEQRSGAENHIY
jgi:hypothetical protein